MNEDQIREIVRDEIESARPILLKKRKNAIRKLVVFRHLQGLDLFELFCEDVVHLFVAHSNDGEGKP